jgi:hypothetical protein
MNIYFKSINYLIITYMRQFMFLILKLYIYMQNIKLS